MKINRIRGILLSVSLLFLPAIVIGKEKKPIKWDEDSQAVYDLLVAQLQNADTDYANSADTLVKFAKKQKDDRLFAKAYRALLQTERYADAVDMVKTWKKTTKLTIDELYVLALALNKQTDKALSVIKDSLKNTDNDTDKLKHYIQILVENWYHPQILTVIKKLYDDYPDEDIVSKAYVHLTTIYGEIDQAVKVIDKHLFKKPNDVSLLQVKSDIYRYDLRLKEAEKVWTDSLSDYPNDEAIRFAYAQFLYDKYDFQATNKQLQLLPVTDDLLRQVLQMKVAVQLGKYQDSEKAFAWDKLSETDIDKARYYYGDELLAKKQYDLALTQLKKISEDSDFSTSAALKIGEIYYTQDNKKADKWFADLQEKYHFDNDEFIREKANAMDKAGKKQQAYQLLTDYLIKNPKNEDIRYMRALLAAEQSMPAQSIADLKRLHATSPDNLDFQNALGYTLLSQRDSLDEATALIKKSLFQNALSPAVVDSMGWAKYQYKQYQEALPYFRFAYRKYLDGEIIGHYIMALMANGQAALAKKLYQLEIQYEPNRKKIKEITKSIEKELSE